MNECNSIISYLFTCFDIRHFWIQGFALLGGLAGFSYQLVNDIYENNKILCKFCFELIGALIVATMFAKGITILFGFDQPGLTAFILGVGWSSIIKIIRSDVTEYVRNALGVNRSDQDQAMEK